MCPPLVPSELEPQEAGLCHFTKWRRQPLGLMAQPPHATPQWRLSSALGSPRAGDRSVNSCGLRTAVLPDRDLIKTFNKEEYGHQRASLCFQVPLLCSSLQAPWMHGLALALPS